MCACKSTDAYDCWTLRYSGHTAVAGTEQEIENDGGPCQCHCHLDEDVDEDDLD